MRRTQFEFKLTEDGTATLDVYEDPEHPHFVVHRPIGTTRTGCGWNLSHKPSACYLASGFRTRELAFAAAAELEPLAEWSIPNPHKPLDSIARSRVADCLRLIGYRNLKAVR